MHLDDEQVQRLQHGELDTQTRAALLGHVAICPDCRARVEDAEREEAQIFDLLRGLDHEAPDITAAAIAAGSARHVGSDHALIPRSPARWAAGILITLGAAGALYAVPASPLRALI